MVSSDSPRMPESRWRYFGRMDDGRQVAAVVDDHIQRLAVGEIERLLDAPIVLGVGLALPGVDRHTRHGDGGRRMVLGRELVATAPLDLGPQLGEGLDQHGRLDGHVQAAGHANAFQRLRLAVLSPKRHEPGHLALGQFDLLSAPIGQRKISYFVRHLCLDLWHGCRPLFFSSPACQTRHDKSCSPRLASPGKNS